MNVEEFQKIAEEFQKITDAASLGNDEAQKILEKLCNNNNNISNSYLLELIEKSVHNNTLYFATKVLTYRIVQNPLTNNPQSMRYLCEILVKLAAHEGRPYSNYVRTQFIKSAVTLAIFNFFGDAIVPVIQENFVIAFNEGALFQIFNNILNVFKRLGPLTVIEFLDEFLCQVLEEWRLNANLPYDHMLLIKKNLVQYSLWYFVKLAIYSYQLGLTVVQSNFNGNEKFAQHLCEFFERALKFSEDEKNPNSVVNDNCDCYHPPKDFRMYELLDLAFMLKRFIPENDGLSLQSYSILTRLSYASGIVFGKATEVSKYRKAYKGHLEALLKTTPISQNNLSSILSIFCNYTYVLYNEASFDMSITSFSKYVASVLNQMIPFIATMLEEGDPEIRKVVRNFGQPMKYLALCMQDDSDSCEIFSPVVFAMFTKLCSLKETLDRSEDSRRTYKTLVTSLTDVSVLFFKEFYLLFVEKYPVQEYSLSVIEDLKSLPWYFYEIGEIMRRSFSEDSQMFHDLVKRSYTNSSASETMEDAINDYKDEIENHTKCLKAYDDALNGIFPNFDQIDFLSSSFSILLWWMNKFEIDMKHDCDELKIQNANILSSSFSALNHGIMATYSRGTVGNLKPDDEFSSYLIRKLLNNIFTMIAKYHNYPNVVDEAMAVIENMNDCGLFTYQMTHFLNFLEREKGDMSNFPKRRKLYDIGAKAACSSTNVAHVQQFIDLCLIPYKQQLSTISLQFNPALMATIDPIDPETMIKIIEIFTGFADALMVFPEESRYGDSVTQFFLALNHVYPSYQNYPIVVKKILKFVAVAVPSIIFHNVEAFENTSQGQFVDNNLNEITGFFKFVEVYCRNNVQKWQERDERCSIGNAENQGYEDLIILMQIVKDTLSRLQLSISSGSDDEIMVIIEHMGSLSLNIFVPLITPIRSSVPDVLKAFSNMLHIIAECNVMSVINFVKDDNNPLFSFFNSILTSSQTPECISQFVTTLDFILQKHEIIFKNREMSSWQKFLRCVLNPIFHIVITSTKEDPLYTISRNCLFYFVYADLEFFKFFIDIIVTKQAVEVQDKIRTAFD